MYKLDLPYIFTMAIDPYEPELAKRAKVREIADKQLRQAIGNFDSAYTRDRDVLKESFNELTEAIKDYHDAAKSLVEWVETKQTNDEP